MLLKIKKPYSFCYGAFLFYPARFKNLLLGFKHWVKSLSYSFCYGAFLFYPARYLNLLFRYERWKEFIVERYKKFLFRFKRGVRPAYAIFTIL